MSALEQLMAEVAARIAREAAVAKTPPWCRTDPEPRPRGWDAAAEKMVRDAVWPELDHPRPLPWRVPPQFVEDWATKWAKYHRETKHERRREQRVAVRGDGAEAGRPEVAEAGLA